LSVRTEGGGGAAAPATEVLSVIETYETPAAPPEAIHTFNIAPAIDFDDDSKLILVLDGSITAIGQIAITVNGIVTGTYNADGRRITGGVETLLDSNGNTQFQPTDVTQLGAVNEPVFLIVEIVLNKSGTADRVHFLSESYGSVQTVSKRFDGTNTTNIASLASIELRSSAGASDFAPGTRATLYRLRRAAA